MNEPDFRRKFLLPFIKDKTVLDLGVGDLTYRSLHPFIAKHATHVLGVELDEKRATSLKKKGFNVVQGDAETIRVKKKFDVVIAGDLIEHINNSGLFLETVKFHLKKGGLFICNTPNIYSLNYVLRGLFCGGNVPHFHEHTVGYTEGLLRELFSRYELPIVDVVYFTHPTNTWGNLVIRTGALISKKWNENILVVAKKK